MEEKQKQKPLKFTEVKGHTIYGISVHFSKTSDKTISDKIK
jgi:hypothetical protein